LHCGDNLHLLLAETTVWRSPPGAGSYILLPDSILLLVFRANSDGPSFNETVPDARISVPVPLDESPIRVSTAMIAEVLRYGAVHKPPPG
jgi:hypothetical protein